MKKLLFPYADFPSGAISERVVNAVASLPVSKITSLIQEKLILVSEREKDGIIHNMTHRNLQWYLLDDYATACEVPLRYFIYGDQMPDVTYYSHFDAEVIALLNVIDPAMLISAEEVVRHSYHNPQMRISIYATPSAKLVSLALMEKRPPKDVPSEQLYRYRADINQEIARFRSRKVKERFVFHIDFIPDICTYYHVSPHWVFSLTGPLLCDTAEADAFFDLFCLLSRMQQISVIAMLLELCPEAKCRLSKETLEQIECVIAQEGGVVSCL